MRSRLKPQHRDGFAALYLDLGDSHPIDRLDRIPIDDGFSGHPGRCIAPRDARRTHSEPRDRASMTHWPASMHDGLCRPKLPSLPTGSVGVPTMSRQANDLGDQNGQSVPDPDGRLTPGQVAKEIVHGLHPYAAVGFPHPERQCAQREVDPHLTSRGIKGRDDQFKTPGSSVQLSPCRLGAPDRKRHMCFPSTSRKRKMRSGYGSLDVCGDSRGLTRSGEDGALIVSHDLKPAGEVLVAVGPRRIANPHGLITR